MSEIAMWLERLVTLLPSIIGLWEAVKVDNPQQQLEAQLELARAMKDRQARETIRLESEPPRSL